MRHLNFECILNQYKKTIIPPSKNIIIIYLFVNILPPLVEPLAHAVAAAPAQVAVLAEEVALEKAVAVFPDEWRELLDHVAEILVLLDPLQQLRLNVPVIQRGLRGLLLGVGTPAAGDVLQKAAQVRDYVWKRKKRRKTISLVSSEKIPLYPPYPENMGGINFSKNGHTMNSNFRTFVNPK